MKTKAKLWIRGLLLALVACIFTVALVACGDKPAPAVSEVQIKAAVGADYGKVDEAHVLTYRATEGAEITYVIKKGNDVATIEVDYVFSNVGETKTLTFNTAGTYTVEVVATLNGKSASSKATITITTHEVHPEVSTITVTPKNPSMHGYPGAEYTVAYSTAPGDLAVVISVKKGNDAAVEGTDYEYNSATKTISFKTVGSYTVTATPEEGTAKTSEAVVIEDHVINSVTLERNATMINSGVEVHINVYPENEPCTLVVLDAANDDAVVADTSYTYNEVTHNIVFSVEGSYKIKVTLTNHPEVSAASWVLTVLEVSEPSFTLSANTLTAKEFEALNVTGHENVIFPDGAEAQNDTWTVEYSVDGTEYATADTENYTFDISSSETVNPFTAKVAGYYKISYSVMCSHGHSNSDSITVHITPADVELALASSHTLTNGWLRLGANSTDTELSYTVDGHPECYNVSYVNGSAPQDASNKVVVNFSTCDTYEVKVVYTHKVVTTHKEELVIKVSVVSNLENSPILGADPFGGTYDQLLSSVGLQLYYDATDKDNNAIANYTGVVYEIADFSNLVGAKDGVKLYKVQNLNNYPYVIVEDFDEWNDHGNDATGTVTIKMTITADSATAVASKVFTVSPSKSGGNVVDLDAYIGHVCTLGDMSVSNIAFDQVQNMVVSKSGLIIHRGIYGSGTVGRVDIAEGVNQFSVEFDFIVLGKADMDGKQNCSLALNLRTGNWNGWSSQKLGVFSDSDAGIYSGMWGSAFGWNPKWNGNHDKEIPSGQTPIGNGVSFKFERIVADGKVNFISYWRPLGGTGEWVKSNEVGNQVDVSTEQGNAGAPVAAIQLDWEVGCFAIQNFKVTSLDA